MNDEDAIKTLTRMERSLIGPFAEALRWALDRAAQPTVDEIVDLLARELPDGYEVTLEIEEGCGSVRVENWDAPNDEPEISEDGGIGERLLLALKACKEHYAARE